MKPEQFPGERAAWRMVCEPREEDDGDYTDAPHGELQSQIDWLERPYGDEDFEPDDEFDPET